MQNELAKSGRPQQKLKALLRTLCSGSLSPRACFAGPTALPTTLQHQPLASRSSSAVMHWMDVLKHGGSTPSFDVLAKTKEYANGATYDAGNDYLADDYVFRGSVVGPIRKQDVIDTQKGFNLREAYPDLDRGVFGFTIDPNNPYRCFFFERWTGTNKVGVKLGPISFPPTNNHVECPMHITSVTWNPEGKIMYESISPPLDRFEGNTMGGGAVFGLLVGGGVDGGKGALFGSGAAPGSWPLIWQQQLNQLAGGFFGKAFSDEADIPDWWKSRARGGEPTDM